MAVYTLGSIHVDWLYRVGHIPEGGETIAAAGCDNRLGGKGAIQSVAAAMAGSEVHHIGAVGAEAVWAVDQLKASGVDVTHVAIELAAPTGHALIFADPQGDTRIVTVPGTNRMIEEADVKAALARARPGDSLLIQNETNAQIYAARRARARGMRVVYSATPFDLPAVQAMLPLTDLLVLHAEDSEQLTSAAGQGFEDLPVAEILTFAAAEGATWQDLKRGERVSAALPPVEIVDMTGACDALTGVFCACRDQGYSVQDCLELGLGAAALTMAQDGPLAAVPGLEQVRAIAQAGRSAG